MTILNGAETMLGSIFQTARRRAQAVLPVAMAGFAIAACAAVIFAACAAVTIATSSSARAESPATYMQRVSNELIAAQRAGSVSAFSNVLRKHMAVPSIGLTALGPHASTLPKTERPAYYNGMINFIAKYSAKEAPKYPVASAVVTGQGDVVVLKKLNAPSMAEFDAMIATARRQARASGLRKADVRAAVRKARRRR